MSDVYIIMNEWTDVVGDEGAEVVAATYYTEEWRAIDALHILAAEKYGVILEPEDNNFRLEDHSPHIQNEEYYVTALSEG